MSDIVKSELKSLSKVIDVKFVENVYEPAESVSIVSLPLNDKMTLATLLTGVEMTGKTAIVNLKVIDDLSEHVVEASDDIFVINTPEGGDAMRIVGLVAVMVLSYYTAGLASSWASAAYGSAYGAVAGGIAGAAVMMAGSAIVNSMFPQSQMSTGQIEGDSSSTYGIDGAKNTAKEGIPVPVVYGKAKFAGNIIGFHVENDGDTQNAYITLNLGEGPVAGIENIAINDTPWDRVSNENSIKDVYIVGESAGTSYGAYANTEIRNTIIPANIGKVLTEDWSYYEMAVADETDAMRLDFVFPSGLYRTADNGSVHNTDTTIIAQYQRINDDGNPYYGSDTWMDFPSNDEEGAQVLTAEYYSITTGFGSHGDPEVNGAIVREKFVTQNRGVRRTDTSYTVSYGESIPYRPTKVMSREDIGGTVDGRMTDFRGRLIAGTYFIYPTTSPFDEYVSDRLDDGSIKTTQVAHGVPIGIVVVRIPESGHMRIVRNKMKPLRVSWNSGRLKTGEGRYRVRYRRTSPASTDYRVQNSITLTDFNKIIYDRLRYVNTGTITFKIRLTDQLTSLPNITFTHKGKILKHYDRHGNIGWRSSEPNPASIVLDMLLSKRYGAGLDPDRIDFDTFYEWAVFCRENALFFNGVFDAQTNVFDAVGTVMRVGRASPRNIGDKFSVQIMRPDNYAQVFSDSNIVAGSLETSWISQSERASEVEITYYDKEKNYETSVVRLRDDSWAKDFDNIKHSETIIGITDRVQALREARLIINANKAMSQTVSFETTPAALGCDIGNIIRVQSNSVDWGKDAGLIKSVLSADTVELDREVDVDAGYQIALKFDTCTVQKTATCSISENTLVMDYSDISAGRAARVKLSTESVWYEVGKTTPADESGTQAELWLETVPTWMVDGTQVTLDVEFYGASIVANVTNSPGTYTQITFSIPSLLTFASPGSEWVIGQAGMIAKDFMVTSITYGTDNNYQVDGIEYNADAFDDSDITDFPLNIAGYTDPNAISAVQSPEVQIRSVDMGNGASKYLAEISWDVLDEDLKAYAGAKVAGTIKGAGGRLVKVNELAGAQERSVSLEVYPDDVIDVQINASSYGGGTSETERLTYTVSMIGEYLAPVTSLTASAGLGDVVLSLTYPDTLVNIKDATIYHAEVPLDYAGDGSEYNHTTQGTIIGNVSFPINTFTHSNVTYANRHLYWVVLNGYNGEYSPVYPSPTALVVDAQETTVLEVEGLLAETSDAFEINLNGAIIPRTKLTWNAPADQTTFQYVIDYKESENAIWERAGSTQTELFYIQGLDPLKLYDIRVKSVLVNGIASAGMEILNYKPATTSATASDYLPYPVTGLEIEKAATDVLSAPNEFLGNEVKFRWRPSSPYAYEIGSETFGADSGMLDPLFSFYEVKIFHPGDPVEKRTESVIDPHYLYTYEKNVDDGLSRDITISVRSVDKHGRRSEARILNVVNPLPQTPNVTFAPGIRFMTISYDKPADVDFKGIVVYGSTASEFVADDTTKLYEGNDATVMINGLEPSTQYFFRIAAFDAFGKDEMVVSAELTATTASLKSQDLDKTPPTTPTDLALSSSVLSAGLSTQSSLSATWTASTDDGFVSGYIVEYWNDADPATVYEKQVATNLFATSDVTSGATYSVRVCAIDWAGNKSEFTPANAVTIAGDTVAPAAITGLVMIPGLSKITVAWDKPAESDFLYVEAYIGTSAGFNVATAVRAYKGMATSFVYEDDSGVAKWVKVRAVDASGNVSAFVEAGPAAGFKIASANVERYFESAAIGNAYISELDAEKITTGFLNAERIQAKSVTTDKLNVLKLSAISADLGEVTAGVVTGAIVRTAASGARVQLDSISGIRGYNSASQETFGVNVDGSGFLGATATKITWDSNGNIQIPGELVAGNLIGNFISTSENALAEWRVDLGDEAYPIRYWDGVNPASTNFSVDTNGNVFVKGAIEITTPSVGYANFTDAPVGVADYANNTQAAIEDTTTITGGGITMSSGGLLKSASANLSTNNGILLGYSGSTYQFLAGNSASGKHIKFDGTDLTVNAGNFSLDGAGNMTATNATISGTLTGATLATSTTGKRTIIDGLGEMTMYNTANELMLTIGVDDATSLTTNWDSDITTVATDEIVISLLRGNPGFNVKYGMFVSSLLNAHTGIVSRAVYGGVAGVGGTYGTQGRGVDASGIGVHGIADGASGKGVVGQGAGYDFYASGAGANYGPFTGAHDGLVQDTLAVEIGDIVCDKRFVSAKNVSNTLFEVELSSSDSLPAIGVVAVEKSDMIPAALTTSEVVDEEVVTTGELPAGFATVQFNAVGEGMINVCGENGDIANGDLIITSSTPGKGMKQLDSVVHNYTVAKARGDWTFETPDEIRMIPCIYLCG